MKTILIFNNKKVYELKMFTAISCLYFNPLNWLFITSSWYLYDMMMSTVVSIRAVNIINLSPSKPDLGRAGWLIMSIILIIFSSNQTKLYMIILAPNGFPAQTETYIGVYCPLLSADNPAADLVPKICPLGTSFLCCFLIRDLYLYQIDIEW